jgi:small GTP-binding protein
MGNALSNFMSFFAGSKQVRVLLLGLDAAGKTATLFRLRLSELVTTIPTIGFNVETVEYKNLKFTMWDIGGQDRLRALWRHYYENTDGVIFIVDSSDRARIKLARDELHKTMEDSMLTDVKLVVFANKQDLPGAMAPSEVADALRLRDLKQQWFVQGTSAANGQGLFEGLDVFAKMLNSASKK